MPPATPAGSVLTVTAAVPANNLASQPQKNTANNTSSATTKVCTAVVAGICIVV
jgi:hypothetical protein